MHPIQHEKKSASHVSHTPGNWKHRVPAAGQPQQLLTDTTTNVGYATAGTSSTAFYLSASTNAKWMYLDNRSVGTLAVAAFSTVTTTLTLPANLHGTYSTNVGAERLQHLGRQATPPTIARRRPALPCRRMSIGEKYERGALEGDPHLLFEAG